jgi:hypothetical protein
MWWEVIDILEELTALIFRVKEWVKQAASRE